MRLFVAIELAPELQEKIAKFTKGWQKSVSGKWVEKHNLHLTLVFIGETKATDLLKLEKQLSLVSSQGVSFELTSTKITVLPPNKPRILSLVFKYSSEFSRLQQSIIKAFKDINIPASAFKPHLTLVRLKSSIQSNQVPNLLNLQLNIKVKHISLMHSSLTAKGPIYRRLKALKLSSGAPSGPLRPNIAICVINPKNEVLLIKKYRNGVNDWKLPQGGVESGESLAMAAKRELNEEVGLTSIKIIKILENVYQYHWPKKLLRQGGEGSKNNYIGQAQSIAFAKISEIRPKIKHDPREAPFSKWVPSHKLLNSYSPIRRGLGRIAMVELTKMISKQS